MMDYMSFFNGLAEVILKGSFYNQSRHRAAAPKKPKSRKKALKSRKNAQQPSSVLHQGEFTPLYPLDDCLALSLKATDSGDLLILGLTEILERFPSPTPLNHLKSPGDRFYAFVMA